MCGDNFSPMEIVVTYANYILTTGSSIVDWENVFGQYWYQTRFVGRSPILDLAPGRCRFTKQNTLDIVGVDIEPAIVSHYADQGINIEQGSAYEIPFPDRYFEGVFCCWLFEHLAQPDLAMCEIGRVLKPGGYACIIVPSPHSLQHGFYDDYTHIRPFTKNSLDHLARLAGFSSSNSDYLFWGRGGRIILRRFGPLVTQRYIRFCDIIMRRLGLVNRNMIALEAYR